MFEKTEKKLENLDSDVVSIEEKLKEYAEKLRQKKEKREETRNLAIVEIVREKNISISDLKNILNNGGRLLDNPKNGKNTPVDVSEAVIGTAEKYDYRKDIDDEEID